MDIEIITLFSSIFYHLPAAQRKQLLILADNSDFWHISKASRTAFDDLQPGRSSCAGTSDRHNTTKQRFTQ